MQSSSVKWQSELIWRFACYASWFSRCTSDNGLTIRNPEAFFSVSLISALTALNDYFPH